jgi:hypothetical protein
MTNLDRNWSLTTGDLPMLVTKGVNKKPTIKSRDFNVQDDINRAPKYVRKLIVDFLDGFKMYLILIPQLTAKFPRRKN